MPSTTPPPAQELRDFKQLNPSRVQFLRKLRTPNDSTKAIVRAGVIKDGIQLAVQFSNDCRVYNVWEALLYVEGYEADGYYVKGTAIKAFNGGANA